MLEPRRIALDLVAVFGCCQHLLADVPVPTLEG